MQRAFQHATEWVDRCEDVGARGAVADIPRTAVLGKTIDAPAHLLAPGSMIFGNIVVRVDDRCAIGIGGAQLDRKRNVSPIETSEWCLGQVHRLKV